MDLQRQVDGFRKHGLTPEETVKRIDLSSHAADDPQARAINPGILTILRMYDVAANPDPPAHLLPRRRRE